MFVFISSYFIEIITSAASLVFFLLKKSFSFIQINLFIYLYSKISKQRWDHKPFDHPSLLRPPSIGVKVSPDWLTCSFRPFLWIPTDLCIQLYILFLLLLFFDEWNYTPEWIFHDLFTHSLPSDTLPVNLLKTQAPFLTFVTKPGWSSGKKSKVDWILVQFCP